jgi:hypothetical protein
VEKDIVDHLLSKLRKYAEEIKENLYISEPDLCCAHITITEKKYFEMWDDLKNDKRFSERSFSMQYKLSIIPRKIENDKIKVEVKLSKKTK